MKTKTRVKGGRGEVDGHCHARFSFFICIEAEFEVMCYFGVGQKFVCSVEFIALTTCTIKRDKRQWRIISICYTVY